tara:strand:+ start:4975 stop:5991 length:1017 start_codon:yes stop_codon:yes gene_type:complete
MYDLGLFFAKAFIFVIAVLAVIGGAVALSGKGKPEKGNLIMTHLSEKIAERTHELKREVLSKKAFKAYEKQRKKEEKEQDKLQDEPQESAKPHIFVIKFKGSIDAHEVSSLREEVSAVLSIAEPQDEVIVQVESGGGMVHGYGLASSQLARLREAGLKLTVCVDKVAASGGYMMACVANEIVAAPFAILGSIGVIAQVPNFHKILKKNDIEFEQHTAGEFKRTLTMFGHNSDEARYKFKQELEETHQLFKGFVAKYRPQLDLAQVATGEHWFGQQALDLQLVDTLRTSDDVILDRAKTHQVFLVEYKMKQKLADKLSKSASMLVKTVLQSLKHQQHYS